MIDSPKTIRETTGEPETDRLNAIMDAWDGLSGREDLERVLREDPTTARGALELRRALATLKDPVQTPDLAGPILGAAHRARPFLTTSSRRRAVTARIMLAASVLVAAGLVMYVQNLGTPTGTTMVALEPAVRNETASASAPAMAAAIAAKMRSPHARSNSATGISTALSLGSGGRGYDPSFEIGDVRASNAGVTRAMGWNPVFPALSSVFHSTGPASSWIGAGSETDPMVAGIGVGTIDSTPLSATWRPLEPWSYLQRPATRPASVKLSQPHDMTPKK